MQFPYPLLVCDIGGTNARVGEARTADAPLRLLDHLKTADYPGLGAAIAAASKEMADKPKSLIVCGAGPIAGRSLRLTNAQWTIDGPELAQELGLAQGLLLNDFEAQALSLPALQPQWLTSIGEAQDERAGGGAQVILGPGTGLGAAALLFWDGRYLPLSSEAGHADFGPASEDESRLWPFLEKPHGRVSVETLISGPGLARLHRARLLSEGRSAPAIESADLAAKALRERTGEEAQSVRLFWRLVARFAGDMALVYLARGGVTLAGGVLPHIIDFLDAREFRRVFEAKSPMDGILRSIPTRLVNAPDTALAGMAAIGAHPERYALDYEARAWRRPA